jgi:phosphohistidine phosphatase
MHDAHTLIVMRHAKAGELPGGPDFERALRPRGEHDSAAAGRTRQTWRRVSKELGGEPELSVERRLYRADSDDLIEIIRETVEQVATLMYVGHNPAAAELVGLLTETEPDFPTAAIAVIAVSADWAGAAPGTGRLVASWSPKTASSDG